MEVGRWKLEDGSWKMEVGRWKLKEGVDAKSKVSWQMYLPLPPRHHPFI
jgi:hypothetical protein